MKEQHNFTNEYTNKKRALMAALDEVTKTTETGSRRIPMKLIAAIAVIALLTVGVFAATRLIEFGIKQDGDQIQISAKLPDRSNADTGSDESKPLRSWVAEDGEISVKLNFGYMPEDITENPTTQYKYSNEEFTRAMTFVGHDLRRSDFDTIFAGAESYVSFEAGKNKSYIVYSAAETAFYNRMLYVLFEEEELLVSVYVSYAITDDELREIAENITVTETDDTTEALPIGNEFSKNGENAETEQPLVYYHENPPEYYDDLLHLGDTGTYNGYYDAASVTVKSIDYYDSMAGFDDAHIIHMDFVKKFVDASGNLLEYNRTEIIRGDGETTFNKYGETVAMTKKFVTVTLTLDYEYSGDGEFDKFELEPPFLHTFSLGGIVILEDGEVRFREGDYDIDRTPGTHAVNHDMVYREYLGENTWRLGYLLDTDELDGELYFFSDYADIGYTLK